jgi:hypothetical protein
VDSPRRRRVHEGLEALVIPLRAQNIQHGRASGTPVLPCCPQCLTATDPANPIFALRRIGKKIYADARFLDIYYSYIQKINSTTSPHYPSVVCARGVGLRESLEGRTGVWWHLELASAPPSYVSSIAHRPGDTLGILTLSIDIVRIVICTFAL